MLLFMSHQVFISHSNQDKAIADRVCAALEANNISCWIAPRDVPTGSNYGSVIIEAINLSQVMVLILSEASNKSEQVVREVERAVAKGIMILPFRIEEVKLSNALEYFLSTHQWLDAFPKLTDGHVNSLVQRVSIFLGTDETKAIKIPTHDLNKKQTSNIQAKIFKHRKIVIGSILTALLICCFFLIYNYSTKDSIQSVDELATHLISELSDKIDLKGKSVLINPFTYKDTKISGEFSKYFKQLLDNSFITLTDWNIAQQASNPQLQTLNDQTDTIQFVKAEYFVNGVYWEFPEGIKFLCTLVRCLDGKSIASVEASVPKTVISVTGFKLTPDNFQQAQTDQKVFSINETKSDSLHLDVFTNRGADNLLFNKNDTMKVFVKVNMPCYVRLIYHQADSIRVLLRDNFEIPQSRVGKYIKIDSFVCDSPFGAEVLQVFAQTQPFDKIDTKEVERKSILTDDLAKFLTTTRGMKNISPASMQTESRIVITTVEK
jgi:hypothetical protein